MKRNITHTLYYLSAIAILAMLLSSCSAEWYMAKAKKKKPELFQKDTMVIHDTTYLAMVKTDTVFRQSMVKDTMVIQKDRLTMRYFYSNDTVFLSGECKDTTIIKEIQVTTEKAIITEGKTPQWKNYLIAGLIAVVLALLLVEILRR